jgi:FkbM family methyltransferase
MSKYLVHPGSQIEGLAEIYERYLTCETGTFVEIGAFDGRTCSNTAGLADSGWHGLYVEANPDFAEVCRTKHANNPRVQVHTAAVAEFEGEADFWLIGECSTLVFDLSAIEWGGAPGRKIRVKVCTLDTLLENRVLPGFELLVIDVEQAEIRVLTGFTISRWKPKMVIIEAHENDPAPHRHYKAAFINDYFARAGYIKVHADHINSIFVLP